MCGIVGYLLRNGGGGFGHPESVLDAMASAIQHRGPDDQGLWHDVVGGVGLAQRRLSIVDLSDGGHQPMHSADRRFVIVFNGEIYNHRDLREELEREGFRFRSSSDTEVLLEAVGRWGVLETCKRLVGMFAFAVWDRQEQRLSLARDRLGKKPLYVYRDKKGNLAFASELKSLWKFPGFAPTIRREAVAQFLKYSYVPEFLSIFNEVEKIAPGTIMTLVGDRSATVSERYWSLEEVARSAASARIRDLATAEEHLLSVLRDATRLRMLADVPLGAFLSGGIDSGLVVSLMQEASSRKVRTFSIGFRDKDFDEAPVAKAVANHLGTDHTELYVTDSDAQQVVPDLPEIFDEPFADASQIPTYLLAKMTRNEVTVALTGDGGDESFGGYMRYRNHAGITGRLYGLPRPVRTALAHTLRAVPGGVLDASTALLPARNRPRFLASKVSKLARALAVENAAERGKAYLSFWSPERLLLNTQASDLVDPYGFPGFQFEDPSECMQFWETLHYLPGDLLAKLDRATMAASLEARSPLLDHRVVELAWRLPSEMKASALAPKRILRNLLFRYVPRELVDLPKQGFSVPIGSWMLYGLRDWVEDTLSYGRNALSELLDFGEVDRAWQQHVAGQIGHVEKLWIVVMFCAWHRRWFGDRGRA